MMLGDKKKAITIILGSLLSKMSGDSPEKSEKPEVAEDEPKYGVESAMKKFMSALKEDDVQKAIEAMHEFQEMSSGVEYMNSESED